MIAMAERALLHCGDASLGDWRERGDAVYHLRRRLTERECIIAGGLRECDLRGSERGNLRLEKLFREQPMLEQIARRIGEYST